LRFLGPADSMTLHARHALAANLRILGEHAAARDLLTDLLEVAAQVFRPEDSEMLTIRHNHAVAVAASGSSYAGARRLLEPVVRESERALGPEHPTTITGMTSLVGLLVQDGETQAALTLAVTACERAVAGGHLADPLGEQVSFALADAVARSDPEMLLDAEEGSIMRHALSIALAAEPLHVLSAWAVWILQRPSEQIASLVDKLASLLDDGGVSSALDPMLISSTWLLHDASASTRSAWIDTWTRTLDGCPDVRVASIVLPVVRDHFAGQPAALLRLPVELREIVSNLLDAGSRIVPVLPLPGE
jgi:hypothetical protein